MLIIKLQLSRCDTDVLIGVYSDDRIPLVMLLLLPLSRLLSPCYHANEVIKFWKSKLFNIPDMYWCLEYFGG